MTAFAGSGGSAFSTTAGNKTVTLAGAAANDLLVVIAANTGQTAAPTITDDQSGTYVEVTGGGFLKNASADKLWVFVRTALVPATQSTIITMVPGGTDTGGGFHVLRLTGMSRTGSAAVRQTAGQANQAAGTPAPVLGVAPLTGNSLCGGVFNGTNPATMTPPAGGGGWTEKWDVGYNSPASGMESATKDSGFTATTVTWGSASASAYASVVVEFDASAAGTNWQQPVTDTLSLADAQSFDRGESVADTVTPSDALAFDRGESVADTLALSDQASPERGLNVPLADTVTVADATPTRETGKGVTIPDTLGLADAVRFDRGLVVADTATPADALAFQRAITQADTLSLADLVAFQRAFQLADTLGLSDLADPQLTTGGGTAWNQPIDDTLALADALAFQRGLSLAETLALADLVNLGRGLGVADALTVADAITQARGLALADAVALTDLAQLLFVPLGAAEPQFTPHTGARGPAGTTDTTGAAGRSRARGTSGRSGTIGPTGRTDSHA